MDNFGFVAGFINYNDAICVIASSYALEKKNRPNAFIGIYKDGFWQLGEVDFTIISIAEGGKTAAKVAVMLGGKGNVIAISSNGDISDELIGGDHNLPNQYSGLSQVKRIGNSFYAVGMRRQVYVRGVLATDWTNVDAGVVVPIESKDISGFLCVDGFSESEVYCAGYRGEIWLYDGSVWTEISSPTNSIIETITCTPNNEVFMGGDDGLILMGRGDSWSVLHQDITDDHIMGSTHYSGRTYFSTETGVIFSYKDGSFREDTPSGDFTWNKTTGSVCSNGKSLLSIGLEDVVLFDGIAWSRISDPPFKL